MTFLTHKQLFDTPFSPHPEVVYINWDLQPKIETVFVEKLQKSEEFKEEKPESNTTTLPVETENSISYEIRNITPKKHLWRK